MIRADHDSGHAERESGRHGSAEKVSACDCFHVSCKE
jgi:hypothetical protein